jgi:hypothetical protein
MHLTPDEFLSLHQGLSEKDVEIERLRTEVARLKQECNSWHCRCLELEEGGRSGRRESNVIILSVEKVKSFLNLLSDFNLISVISAFLQKTLADDSAGTESRTVQSITPLPQRETMSITTQGDLNVAGNFVDFHDNQIS